MNTLPMDCLLTKMDEKADEILSSIHAELAKPRNQREPLSKIDEWGEQLFELMGQGGLSLEVYKQAEHGMQYLIQYS